MNAPAKHPHIQIQPVKSSNIAGLGYDAPSQTLEVHFQNGGRYRYSGVSHESFTAFLQSDSKGAYFARHIRGLHEGANLNPKPAST